MFKRFCDCVRGMFVWDGLRPDNLDMYEPLPYIRRLLKDQHDAGLSGFLIGVWFVAAVSTIVHREPLGVVLMAVSVVGYLFVNMHRFKALPVAIIGLLVVLVGSLYV